MAVYRHDIPNASVPKTRAELETALDAGLLWVRLANARYLKARRNGKTRTWKRRPREFSIPLKYGFNGHTYVNDADLNADMGNHAVLIEG